MLNLMSFLPRAEGMWVCELCPPRSPGLGSPRGRREGHWPFRQNEPVRPLAARSLLDSLVSRTGPATYQRALACLWRRTYMVKLCPNWSASLALQHVAMELVQYAPSGTRGSPPTPSGWLGQRRRIEVMSAISTRRTSRDCMAAARRAALVVPRAMLERPIPRKSRGR